MDEPRFRTDLYTGTAAYYDRYRLPYPDELLERAGFTHAGHTDFLVPHTWTVDELLGFVYSTSVLSRPALGAHLPAFERDCREPLLASEPDGLFRADASFGYDLASSTSNS